MSDDATVIERSTSVSRVGRLLKILIALKMIVAALALYWMVREVIVLLQVRGSGNVDAPRVRAVVSAGRFIWVVNSPLLFASIFVWLIWQFFVHDLVARTEGAPLRFGRWASVGWWFVPFANLVQPFLVMKDLWERRVRSDDPAADRRLLRWWLPWDAQVATLYLMLFVGIGAPTVDRSIAIHIVAIAGEGLFLACTLPAIAVVRALTEGVTVAVPTMAVAEMEPIPARVDRDGEPIL
jgi:hypothetical protein